MVRVLERARHLAGLSQEAFAEQLGVTRSAYAQWLSGRRESGPAATVLLKALEIAAEHSPSTRRRWTPDRIISEVALDYWEDHFLNSTD